MNRAKLRALTRNAAVVLGNVGTPDDSVVLGAAAGDADPLVAEHEAWALETIHFRAAVTSSERLLATDRRVR